MTVSIPSKRKYRELKQGKQQKASSNISGSKNKRLKFGKDPSNKDLPPPVLTVTAAGKKKWVFPDGRR